LSNPFDGDWRVATEEHVVVGLTSGRRFLEYYADTDWENVLARLADNGDVILSGFEK
jgi:hypothetical protein